MEKVLEEMARDLVKKLSAKNVNFNEIREFVVDMDREIMKIPVQVEFNKAGSTKKELSDRVKHLEKVIARMLMNM